MDYDKKLLDLGISLPQISKPSGNYIHVIEDQGVLYVAGKGVGNRTGKIGVEYSVEDGYEFSRETGLLLLSAVRESYGTLNVVGKILRVYGMVNCNPDFEMHPEVINGCSDLLIEVFGNSGRHVRMAVGANSLPHQTPVEIEMSLRMKNIEQVGAGNPLP